MAWLIGIDVGGTFTDFYAVDTPAAMCVCSNIPRHRPIRPRRSCAAWRHDARHSASMPATVERIGHGTTVATNALIQRRAARWR